MAWILLCFDVLPTLETQKEVHAMLHQNTAFHGLLKYLPWHYLKRLLRNTARTICPAN